MIKNKFIHNLDSQKIIVKVDNEKDDGEYFPKVAGSTVPLLRLFNETIEFNQIDRLDFSIGNSLIPSVSIRLNDADEKYKHRYPVSIGTIFTFFLGHAKDLEHQPIKGDFYVTSANSGGEMYNISGILHLPEMHILKNRVFENKTSLEVFESIAKECKLGFVTNVDASNDAMNWIQHQSNSDFLAYLSNKSFVNDSTFISMFIDQYWNLNIIDVRKSLEASPIETFITNPITGEKLNEKDILISATNVTEESNKDNKFNRFVYNDFSMTDDYSNIAISQPKALKVIDLNVSSLLQTAKILKSPHNQHMQELSVHTTFSNDNAYSGYFQSNVRNGYNTLLTKGQRFSATTTQYIPGMYLFMSYHQKIYNPPVHSAKISNDASTSVYEDSKPDEDFPSMKVSVNEKLSGDVLVTGMTISYIGSQNTTPQMMMSLSLLLKPTSENNIHETKIVTGSTSVKSVNNQAEQYEEQLSTGYDYSSDTETEVKIDEPPVPEMVANPNPPVDDEGNPVEAGTDNSPAPTYGGRYDIRAACTTLTARGTGSSKKRCAEYVRVAINAGGLNPGSPRNGKDYKYRLPELGFTQINVNAANYNAKKGDIACHQPYPGGHWAGHVAMFNGYVWISDYRQVDVFGGPGYRARPQNTTIWRWI